MRTAILIWALAGTPAYAVPAATAPAATAPAPATVTCADPLQALIDAVRVQGSKVAYLCLIAKDEAGPALIAAAAAGGVGHERVTRALAVWRMPRLDARVPDDEARTYSPADRRLLRDAVQARRGRPSPVAEDQAIFAQFDWYKPDPHYTIARLTDLDRANLALFDKPPEVPKPVVAPAADAMKEAAPAAPAAARGCGCAVATPTDTGAELALIGLAALLRRRRPSKTRRVTLPSSPGSESWRC